MLRAYVDASTRGEPELLTVAAYVIDSSRVRRFRQAWRRTFGDAVFSWADFIGRAGPFRHLGGRENNAEHDRMIAEGIRLIRDNVLVGSVVSVWVRDVENHGPTFIKGFGNAYSVAGHLAIAGLGRCAKKNGIRGGIAYVIEAGDDGYDQLEHLLSRAPKSPELRELYQWAGHSLVPKTSSSPFHAPDTLAWEWGKFMLETGLEKKRPMRMSFAHLINGRLGQYLFNHIHGESMMRFFSQVRDLGVQQMQEDADALRAVEEMDVSEAVTLAAQPPRA